MKYNGRLIKVLLNPEGQVELSLMKRGNKEPFIERGNQMWNGSTVAQGHSMKQWLSWG
jgi:hypothetical protein